MRPIQIYVGFDGREEIAYHLFCRSVLANTRAQVAFIPITGEQHQGASNSFNLIRFRVAEMAGFRGMAIYADSDMLLRKGGDVQDLIDLAEPYCAVSVAQHQYATKHPVKYWGQQNLDYPRKNWSSLQVIDCQHAVWRRIAERGYADETAVAYTPAALHRFSFIANDDEIGRLPLEWNWLVGEYDFKEDVKLAHFTLGIPPHFAYDFNAIGYVAEWWREYAKMIGTAAPAEGHST